MTMHFYSAIIDPIKYTFIDLQRKSPTL